MLAATLMGAVVVIGVALSFTVGDRHAGRNGNQIHTHAPGVWVYAVILAVGVLAATLAQSVGYRVAAIEPSLDPAEARAVGLQAYQRSMMLRFAFSESVAIVSIAVLFAAGSNTILPYVLGGAIAELLMAVHVWPSESLIRRVQRRLDHGGGNSNLQDALKASA